MPSPCVPEEHTRLLHQLKDKIFNLVCNTATPEQWAEWLDMPLELAADDVELVDDLLAAGADAHVALHMAVSGGHENVVQALLDNGAHNSDYKNEYGEAPIHMAAELGHEEIVALLLQRGANVDSLDTNGCSPLLRAAENGCLSTAKTLLSAGADVSVKNNDCWSALDLAASYGHEGVIRELLQHGADLMSVGPDGKTALHLAARKNQTGAIGVLVEAGADFTSRDHKGRTVLHLAAEWNRADAVDALVEAGADVNARLEGDAEWTALHWAAYYGNFDALLALLQHEADVDAEEMEGGQRSLHLACRKLHQEGADLLLRWGADETNVDDSGLTAFEVVGDGIRGENKRQARAVDMERMRKLLTRAPADRAWRRRGFLVLCRAFPDKVLIGLSNNPAVGGDSMEQTDSVSSGTRINKRAKTWENGVDNIIGDADRAERGGASVEDICGSLCEVETRVVALEQDGLFRLIVSFL